MAPTPPRAESEAGDFDSVALDIIYLILLCLPVSSLLRFKSVCKSWLSLIESSDFVEKHMRSLISDDDDDLLLILSRRPFPYHHSPDHHQQISLFRRRRSCSLLLDFPIIDDPFRLNPVRIVGSCRGIVCLQQGSRVCLWNPATKQCSNLPPLPVFSPLILCQFSLGFGFDSRANDYKLVSLNYVYQPDHFFIHVYSLRSDRWRKFEGTEPHTVVYTRGIKAPYHDRIYCWECGNVIYTFDFSDEVFGEIPGPRDLPIDEVFVLNQNIACIAGDVVWMLSNYQDGGESAPSWTELYSVVDATVRPGFDIRWFSKNGDFLLFRQDKQQLCLYDLVTRGVMNLAVHDDDRNDFEVVMYRQSMVSVQRGGNANAVKSMDCGKRRMLINQSITENSSWGDYDVHKDTIMFRILLWLPARSLQRFKSVRKSWHSLVKSCDFITQHLFFHQHRHKFDKFNFILFSVPSYCCPLFIDASHPSLNASRTCLLSSDRLELLDFPYVKDFWRGSQYIVGSLNGIICLRDGGGRDVYLWNPATKQLRVIDPPLLSKETEDNFYVGFGFDDKTNDYKLVRFSGGGSPSVVQVYSLISDSWRTMHDEILPTVARNIPPFGHAQYKDDICCWLPNTDYSRVILTFDFSNEVFRTIPLPDSINNSYLTLALTVLRDKIVCISLGERYERYYDDNDAENWHCEIWMMSEYGVAESWVKQCVVGPFSKDWRFSMCYAKKNGDSIVIMLVKDGQLYEYNLFTQDLERLSCQIQGPDEYQVVAYEESFVTIK